MTTEAFTRVYRFTDRKISQKSRLASSSLATQVVTKILWVFPDYRKMRAYAHAAGLTRGSPFVSVVLDINALASSPDPGVRVIATGEPAWARLRYGLERAPDIGIFEVPSSRLFGPDSAQTIQIAETERLFWGDDLPKFLVEWMQNPF